MSVGVLLGLVRRDDEGEPGGEGAGGGAQFEPHQQLAARVVVVEGAGLVAALPPTALQRDEGDDVLLPELHVVNAHILPRLPAGKLEDVM